MSARLVILLTVPVATALHLTASVAHPRARAPSMTCDSRRSWLQLVGAASVSAVCPSAAFAKGPDYAGASDALKAMIAADPNIGPTMLRLAWHSSGTYDAMSKTGGSGGGTIRFKEELAHGGNAGLDKMVAKLEPIHAKFPDVSYADLYTLGGKVAIEAAGGPTIAWRAGRVDALSPDAVTPDGRLPDADKGSPAQTLKHLRFEVFYRMGFNDQEIVALSGAHALGYTHPDASGYSGPWTPTPTVLNNYYYNLLLSLPWTLTEYAAARPDAFAPAIADCALRPGAGGTGRCNSRTLQAS